MISITDVDRKKIVGYIKKGLGTPGIMEMFQGTYTRQQIAAIRAWVTMDKKKGRSWKSSNFCKGDKERVVAYVKEGLTTAVIVEKFKGRYTRQQIAALRAWVTMGKY